MTYPKGLIVTGRQTTRNYQRIDVYFLERVIFTPKDNP